VISQCKCERAGRQMWCVWDQVFDRWLGPNNWLIPLFSASSPCEFFSLGSQKKYLARTGRPSRRPSSSYLSGQRSPTIVTSTFYQAQDSALMPSFLHRS
jgi:hypothetical protein